MSMQNKNTAAEVSAVIDNLNAAYAKRPVNAVSDTRSRRDEEAAFRRYIKELGVWERTVWEPAYEAVKEADIKLKFDHLTGRYYARFDADGKERFAIRVTCKRHFDIMVSASDAKEAKELALHAMKHEKPIAAASNVKPRFTFETTTEDTSVIA